MPFFVIPEEERKDPFVITSRQDKSNVVEEENHVRTYLYTSRFTDGFRIHRIQFFLKFPPHSVIPLHRMLSPLRIRRPQ